MARTFGRLFCRHVWRVIAWHYTHGPGDNSPLFIQVRRVCLKCGRVDTKDYARGGSMEEYLLEWSRKNSPTEGGHPC